MLKTIHVNGVPYVCGRKRAEPNLLPKFSIELGPRLLRAASEALAIAKGEPLIGVDSIRAAAKTLKPIYASAENILGNDKYGDCTCAAALKIQAIFDCASGREWRVPMLDDATWLYSQVTSPPFDPATGANDNGTSLQAALAFWQSHGLYKDGHGKIKAAYAVDATNKAEVIAALEQYGVLYCGCDLPPAWEKITGTGFTWPMDGPPDPNAGHCTFVYGHNETGVFDGSWGMEGTVPWDALAYYFGAQNGGELFAVAAA